MKKKKIEVRTSDLIKKPRIIIYDIENAYTVSATWGLYDQDVAKVIRLPFIMSISWKELGSNVVHCKALPDFRGYKKNPFDDKELVRYIRDEVLERGDVFVAHNGNSHDLRWIYGRMAIHNMKPPVPKQHIDTLLVARSKFNYPSYKLKDLLIYYKLPQKIQNEGIDLWYKCIENQDMSAWREMKIYNKGDVVGLEQLYLKLRPYITNHPNLALMSGEAVACPNCQGFNMQKAKLRPTRVGWKQQWQCQDCGAYHTSTMQDGSQVR